MKKELEKTNNRGMADKTLFEKKRNRAIFCMGINSALRVSDIRTMNLIDVFKENLSFQEIVDGNEQKTKKYKEFVLTYTLQEELANYICYYLSILYDIRIGIDKINLEKLSDQEREQVKEIVKTKPLFPSERTSEYLSRQQIYRILNQAAANIGLEKIGTHTMRKTFRLLVLSKDKRYCYAPKNA